MPIFMDISLKLAEKGRGATSTNPLVGAVIVKNNKIIGQGYHRFFGGAHAEAKAINQAGRLVKGSTMYVTLEPCCYFSGKKTPACVDLIINSGIKEVVVAMKDPNPNVSGRSMAKLKRNGINVIVGVLEEKAKKINEGYVKYIKTGLPFVISKMAISLDGKIATSTNDSKWISNELSRKLVHKMRSEVDGVLVGVNTVIRDNPELNVRLVKGREPFKIIVDEKCKIPLNSKLLRFGSLTLVATTQLASKKKMKLLKEKGVKILITKLKNGFVDLKDLLKKLPELGICSVMIEGGSSILTSAIKDGLVDKIMWFKAPKIIGGDGLDVVGQLGIKNIRETLVINNIGIKKIEDDVLIEGYLCSQA
ncbi:MAG: bifunctional diaminohydroxyphosphoribosylaminopyrimidine deaminase/5-amino-6-(5-phosphoribosylamino)uracil reductase RibD [Candidatus Firestonebacteria bacterium]